MISVQYYECYCTLHRGPLFSGHCISCHPRGTCHIAGCCHLSNSMSWSQSHVLHCTILPPDEFNVLSSQSHMPYCRVKESILHIIENHSLQYFIFFVFLMPFGLQWVVAFVSSSIHLFECVFLKTTKAAFTKFYMNVHEDNTPRHWLRSSLSLRLKYETDNTLRHWLRSSLSLRLKYQTDNTLRHWLRSSSSLRLKYQTDNTLRHWLRSSLSLRLKSQTDNTLRHWLRSSSSLRLKSQTEFRSKSRRRSRLDLMLAIYIVPRPDLRHTFRLSKSLELKSNKKLSYRWQTARRCFVKLSRYWSNFIRKRRQEDHNRLQCSISCTM